MSNLRDQMSIWTGKSSEFRNPWNCWMMASCSSVERSSKLMALTSTMARMEPSLRMITPSVICLSWTRSVVDGLAIGGRDDDLVFRCSRAVHVALGPQRIRQHVGQVVDERCAVYLHERQG